MGREPEFRKTTGNSADGSSKKRFQDAQVRRVIQYEDYQDFAHTKPIEKQEKVEKSICHNEYAKKEVGSRI